MRHAWVERFEYLASIRAILVGGVRRSLRQERAHAFDIHAAVAIPTLANNVGEAGPKLVFKLVEGHLSVGARIRNGHDRHRVPKTRREKRRGYLIRPT